MRCLWIALLIPFAVGCAQPAPPPPAAFAFVLLGEGADGTTVPMLRTVVEAATSCPELRTASGRVSSMSPRQRPEGGGFRYQFRVADAVGYIEGEQAP